MELRLVEPSLNYPRARRLSENDVWEMGIYPVMFGFRVRVGLAGDPLGYTFDYCAGDDVGFVIQLYVTVMALMEALPETITENQLLRLIPSYQVRPIDRDPCWEALQALVADLQAGADWQGRLNPNTPLEKTHPLT